MAASLTQGSLAEETTAFGKQHLREGFGLTPEDDVLYALGWPRLTWLEPGDATAKELANSKLFSSRYPFSVRPTPVGVVPRRLRSLVAWRAQNSDSIDAQNDTSPIKSKEREALLDFALTELYGFAFTFLLESILTTPVVLDGFVARLRAMKPKKLSALSSGGALQAIHWLLLRTDAPRARDLRAELSAIHAAAAKHGESRAIEGLDLAVNGRAGVERSGEQDDDGVIMNDVEYAIDDLDFVRDRALAFLPKMKAADRSWVSARLAFLGGDAGLAAIAANTRKIHASGREALVLGLSRCAHPLAAEIVASVAPKKTKKS